LDFKILKSPFQSSIAWADNIGHNSILGITDFHFVDGTSQTTASDYAG
jgi:hypothetical protein